MFISCEIRDGFVDTEKIAEIVTSDGTIEQVAVSETLIEDDALKVFQVGRKNGEVLVELPVESATGRWRIWVKNDVIRGTCNEVPA